MTAAQPRSHFLANALEHLVHAARQLAEWPNLCVEQALDGDIQQRGTGGDGSGNVLRQRYAFSFLAAALLPLHQQPVPTLAKVFWSVPSIRLVFLPPSRGPPSSERQPESEARTG